MKSGLTKAELQRGKDLFKQICYSPHRAHVDSCVQLLHSMSDKLAKYMSKEIDPLLANFSRGYLSDVHAIGYNTTSPAESMNRLLKHGLSGAPTLAESRRHFTTVLMNHDRSSAMKLARRRLPVLTRWIPSDLYMVVGRRTADALMKEFNESESMELSVKEGQLGLPEDLKEMSREDLARVVFVAMDRRNKELMYQLTINECQCGLTIFRGLPCSHLIGLYKKLQLEFPKHLVHKRCEVPIGPGRV